MDTERDYDKHPGNPFTEFLTQRCSEWMPPRSQAVALALAACQARGVSSWTRCVGQLARMLTVQDQSSSQFRNLRRQRLNLLRKLPDQR
jgi:hypothetical protein